MILNLSVSDPGISILTSSPGDAYVYKIWDSLHDFEFQKLTISHITRDISS